MSTRYSDTQSMIATALQERAARLRRKAKGRGMRGPENARQRAVYRETARRSDVLAEAILRADPLDLDAVVDQQ